MTLFAKSSPLLYLRDMKLALLGKGKTGGKILELIREEIEVSTERILLFFPP